MAESSPLSRWIAQMVVGGGYLSVGVDGRVAEADLAQQLAQRVVEEMAWSGLAVEAVGDQAGVASEFLQKCALMDRVRLYAQRLVPAPTVPWARTSAGDRVWRGQDGPEVAAAFLDSGPQEHFEPDPRAVREELCAGRLDPRDLIAADRAVELQVRELGRAIDEAGERSPGQDEPLAREAEVSAFLDQVALMDRVRAYASGAGECPSLEGLTVRGSLLWSSTQGPPVARAVVGSASQSLERLSAWREPRPGETSVSPQVARVFGLSLGRWLKTLVQEVNEAAEQGVYRGLAASR